MIIRKNKNTVPMAAAVISVVLISMLSACSVKPAESNIEDITPSEIIAEEATGSSPTVISLDGLEPYEAPKAALQKVESSDIKEILAELTAGETGVYFYRAQNDDIYGAYTAENGDVCRFIQAYDADEHSGYQSGFSIEPYENLFGHNGFIMGYGIGAPYHAYEYYYFDDNRIPVILTQCYNNHVICDLDNDGHSELATFYSMSGSPYIFFERDKEIYMADVISIVQTAFPEWQRISSDSKVHMAGNSGAAWINLYYTPGDNGKSRYCTITFTPEMLTVDTEMKFEPLLVTGEAEEVSSIVLTSSGGSATLGAEDAGKLFALLKDSGFSVVPFPEHMEAQTSGPKCTITVNYSDGKTDTIHSTETGRGYYRLLDTYGDQEDQGYIYTENLNIYDFISGLS
jgi:hypothetical protein